MMDATATSCARAFLTQWVARFGVPSSITSDRGAQFESDLWSELNRLLGSTKQRTTSYHPAGNGIIERHHRHLKSALKARLNDENWIDALPVVLLGIRTSPKDDIGCSSAELVYGTTIRLPGEFFDNSSANTESRSVFLDSLRQFGLPTAHE